MSSRLKTRARTAKADKKINEKFRKRKRSLVNKADQLAKLCQADVYLVVSRENQYITYSSTEKAGWPPSKDELVGNSSDIPTPTADLKRRTTIGHSRSI